MKNRINKQITSSQVLLISQDGENLGTVDTPTAIKMAEDANMDLIEVNPSSSPSVCKIGDYSKIKYLEKKKSKNLQTNKTVTKEIKIRVRIDRHDLEHKVNNIKKMLQKGNDVKIIAIFKGRDAVHSENGMRLIEQVLEMTKDVALIKSPPKPDGTTSISTIISIGAAANS